MNLFSLCAVAAVDHECLQLFASIARSENEAGSRKKGQN
jgi:hypothetical protein